MMLGVLFTHGGCCLLMVSVDMMLGVLFTHGGCGHDAWCVVYSWWVWT